MTPRPHHTHPKRLPHRRKAVTVCIGSIGKDYIVTVSDTKLSAGGYYSHPLASLKIHQIHYLWSAMVAGEVSQAQPLLNSLSRRVLECAKEEPTLEDMSALCTKVYQEYTVQLAEEGLLAPFGLSMSDFLNSRERMGDTLFEQVWAAISKITVGCDLLVCGYSSGVPHIFSVSNPTVSHPSFITYYDEPGFAAIGTGGMLAEATLYSFEHGKVSSLEETIYRTTYAKFVAESASDIGEDTVIRSLDKDGNVLTFDPSAAMDLRDKYIARDYRTIPEPAKMDIAKGMEAATVEDSRYIKTLFHAAVKRYCELTQSDAQR